MKTRPEQGIRARLLRGVSWTLLGKAGSAGLGIVISILLARLLPAAEVGTFFQITALLAIGTGVFQLGLPQTVVRVLASAVAHEESGRVRHLARSAAALALMAGLTAMLVVYALLSAGNALPLLKELAPFRGTLAWWLFALVAGGIMAECFRGVFDLRLAAIFGGLLAAALVAGTLAAHAGLSRQIRLDDVLAISLAAALANAALAYVLGVAHFGARAGTREHVASMREVLAASVPLGATNVLLLLFSQADVLILGALRDSESVALYGAAARLVAVLALSLNVVNLTVAPFIAELGAQQRKAELERMLRRTATLTGWSAFVLLLLLAWQGHWLLEMVFGATYADAVRILVILAAGQTINVLAGSCGTALAMFGHNNLLLGITAVCGMATLGGAVLLGQHWGGEGVALAIAGGLALQNLCMVLAVRWKAGIWTHAHLSLPARSG